MAQQQIKISIVSNVTDFTKFRDALIQKQHALEIKDANPLDVISQNLGKYAYFLVEVDYDNDELAALIQKINMMQVTSPIDIIFYDMNYVRPKHKIKHPLIPIIKPDVYPNINFKYVTDQFSIPWNAIYSSYFWGSLKHQNGQIELFNDDTFQINEADLALLILSSRYLAKVGDTFNFGQDIENALTDWFHNLTIYLHTGKGTMNKQFVFSTVAIPSTLNQDKIWSYLSSDPTAFVLDPALMTKISTDMSSEFKTLKFDYFLRALVSRWKTEAIETQLGPVLYQKYFSYFSRFEHGLDFEITMILEFEDYTTFETYEKAVNDAYDQAHK